MLYIDGEYEYTLPEPEILMPIPDQVKEQVAKIDEHYRQLSDDNTAAGTTNPGEEGLAGTPSVDNRVDPPAEPTGATVDEDFETRYNVLQGKYNAEVPRLHQTVREQAARLQGMEQLIASMQQRAAQPEQPETVTVVTDADREAYGDSLDVMRRVFAEESADLRRQVASLTQAVQQMTNTVVPRVNEVARQQVRNADEQFWQTLGTLVPNWQAINDDNGFKSWLLEHDPMAGTTRQALLEIAHRNLDARRVASFFNTWTSLNNSAAAPQGGAKRARPNELEAQVSPGRGRSAPTPAPNAPKQYTREEISKFYADVRRGVYRGRDEERAKIEREIFAAGGSGRVG